MRGVTIVSLFLNIGLLGILVWLIRGNFKMVAETDRLRGELEENTSVIDSTILLINGLANRLREALMSTAALEEVNAIADELDANNTRLAAAVAANTLSENDSDEFDVSDLEEPIPVGEDDADGAEGVVESDAAAPVSSGEADLSEVPASPEDEPESGESVAGAESDTTADPSAASTETGPSFGVSESAAVEPAEDDGEEETENPPTV